MTTSDLDRAQKIVSKAKRLTQDINILEKTKSTKVILVFDDGHDLSLFAKSIRQLRSGQSYRKNLKNYEYKDK